MRGVTKGSRQDIRGRRLTKEEMRLQILANDAVSAISIEQREKLASMLASKYDWESARKRWAE